MKIPVPTVSSILMSSDWGGPTHPIHKSQRLWPLVLVVHPNQMASPFLLGQQRLWLQDWEKSTINELDMPCSVH